METTRPRDEISAHGQEFGKMYRELFEHALHGLCLLDRKLSYLEVNPALCRILGRTREELVGSTARDFAYEEIDAALERHGEWRGVLPHMASDGRLQLLDWSLSKHPLPDVRIAVVLDVTELRLRESDNERLLESERAAREKAERADRLKDDYVATLSHDLRSPLNAILGWTHLLQHPDGEHDELVKGLEIIRRNARVQAQLITDMLDLSRIASGKLSLELQDVDPAEPIEAAVREVRAQAEAKRVSVRTSFAAHAGRISADSARLQQVVRSLLQDALASAPAETSIEIEVARAEDGVEIRISHAGVGFPAELGSGIFEPQRKLEAGSARTHRGLGLDLALIKALVELHGGSVHASSRGEDQGATFAVRLPSRPPSAAASPARTRGEPPVEEASVDLSGNRVLVVDDDPDARQFVCNILRRSGAETRDAGDVRTAMREIEVSSPHILISDIGMPGEDGYDLIRQVRVQGMSAIALTAYARDIDRKRALDAGFDLHLSKPVEPRELLEAVRSLSKTA